MKPGTVVLVRFPFANLDQTKKRPALVLSHIKHSSQIQLITLAMITSKLEGLELEGDLRLKDWETAHLLHPSLVRLTKVATVDLDLIDREMGTISERDRREVGKIFRKLYRHWL